MIGQVLLLILFCFAGCTSFTAMSQEERRRTDIAIDEMRIAIADLNHALHASEVDVSLLEERVKKQEAMLLAGRHSANKGQELKEQLQLLEKKAAYLQQAHEETLADLEQLRTHANQTSQSLKTLSQQLSGQNQKFDEIGKLKTTLGHLSQAIRTKSTHRVQSGETLERIARLNQTTVTELKRLNKLENDRIYVDQELLLP